MSHSPDPAEGRATIDLATAHARFAKAAIGIYLAVAALAVALLVITLATDRRHDENQLRRRLVLETDVRAHALAKHLGLLVSELRRLGLREEMDPGDHDLGPERSLLQLSHEKSAFFNVGVALLGRDGRVLWAEPQGFLATGKSFANKPWYAEMLEQHATRIVPVAPDRPDALLYMLSPIVRDERYAGALLGAVDLVSSDAMDLGLAANAHALTVLATRDGTVIYPAVPPPFSQDPEWRESCRRAGWEPSLDEPTVQGRRMIAAAAPVLGTDLLFVSLVPERGLFAEARHRMEARVGLGLLLALAPLGLLIVLLQRSLAIFRKSEETAVREQRLRLLGEASNLIAHEVKNSLNGLSMGLELMLREPASPGARERITKEMRGEIAHLADFTTGLMAFSKGIVPRPIELDLCELLTQVTALVREASEELGASLEMVLPDHSVPVRADPALLRVAISNLVGNALDAVASRHDPEAARIVIALDLGPNHIEVRVADNGPGVSEDMLPRLFEPFQTGKPSGVGIGLALAKKIALAHGGDLRLIQLGADDGAGATFVLSLPRSREIHEHTEERP